MVLLVDLAGEDSVRGVCMWVWDGRREGGKGGGRLRAVFCEKGDVRTKKGWILRLVAMYVYMV